MNTEKLISQFEDVGLKLKVAEKPFAGGRNAEMIFGLDIRRAFNGNARSEYFLCWPGHEDTIVNISATDKKLAQLVLTVKEAEVEFQRIIEEFMYRSHIKKYGDKWLSAWIKDTRPRVSVGGKHGMRDARPEDFVYIKGTLWMNDRTPGNVRHFLIGRDERQLFMCQLPKAATSVKAAHDSLKSPTVILAEGKQLGRTYRQGEWFFLNCTKEEEQEIEKYLRSSTKIVYEKVSIGLHAGRRGGKPHVVDELIKLRPRPLEHGFPVRQREEVFVRGAVRHSDHETLKIGSWRKVILNAEQNNNNAGLGGTWID